MNFHKVDNVNIKSAKVDEVSQVVPDVAETVFEAIHSIMHTFRSEQYRVLRDGPYDLTHMEGKMLGFFARHPRSTLSDLVNHSGRDKGQLARLIKTLKNQELLVATTDSKDRRSVCLELTKAGQAVHKNLHKEMQLLSEKAVNNLSSSETKQLVTLLRRVELSLEEISPD